MSVYTTISKSQLSDFLQEYDIGDLVSYEGIGEGIENTNYFVETKQASYVLTIFEHLRHEELPYFLDLMAHVSESGSPCPHPVADRQGDYLKTLADKPATILTRLAGKTLSAADERHCQQVGLALAHFHRSSILFPLAREDGRGIVWGREQSQRLEAAIDQEDAELLHSEIEWQKTIDTTQLPQGTIHADLFKDNVLFDGDVLTGLIDFYYACKGSLLYDLAVTVNAWCRNPDGAIESSHYQSLVDAYKSVRHFEPAEIAMWQDVMRRAALRFWVSRMSDSIFPREGEITHVKNPDVFKNILLDCRRQVPSL